MAAAETSFAISVVLLLKDQLSGGMNKTLGGVNKQIAKFSAVASAGAIATRGMSQGARGMLEGFATAGADLDEALHKVRSLPGVTDEATREVSSAGIDWMKSHRQSATQYAETFYDAWSAGITDVGKANELTRTAMLTANATMGDHREAAQLLGVIYNNTGRSIEETGDIITRTQQTFQFADLNQLTAGMQYAMAPMNAYRVELEQVTAVIGQLNNAGLQGSQAGTAFQATMGKLNEASRKLRFGIARAADGGVDFIGTLRNIKAVYGDLDKLSPKKQLDFQKAFGGTEALRAVVLLSSKLEILDQNYQAVKDYAGAAAEAASIRDQSWAAQWAILLNNLQAIRLEIGGAMLPALKSVVPMIRELASGVASFAREHPGVVKFGLALTGIVALASPLLMLVGTLGLAAMGIAAISAPVWLTIGAVVALGAAVVAAVVYWDEIKAAVANAALEARYKFGELVDWFKTLPAEMQQIGKDIVMGIWHGIQSMWGGWLVGNVTRLIAGLVSKVRGKDGIDAHSPSRVFERIGADVTAGLAQGIARGGPGVEGALKGTLERVRAATGGLALSALVSASPAAATPQGASGALSEGVRSVLPAPGIMESGARSVLPAPGTMESGARSVLPAPGIGGSGGGSMNVGDIHITIHAAPGSDERALARIAADEVERVLREQRHALEGRLFD